MHELVCITIISISLVFGIYFILLYMKEKRQSMQTMILYKEMSHRVTNSLALLGNVMSLNESQSSSKIEKVSINGIMNRVRSIEHLHRLLYSSPDNDSVIHVDQYCELIIKNVIQTYQGPNGGEEVATEMDIPPLVIDSNRCSLIGLLLNELLTNSFKHAIMSYSINKPKITLSIERLEKGQISFFYSDNFDIERGKAMSNSNFGEKLISMCVQSLNGHMTKNRTHDFQMTFPYGY